ncbi:hypothetical protein Tco_0636974 [Tanacetum coccineum]
MTRSAGRPVAESLGGGNSVQEEIVPSMELMGCYGYEVNGNVKGANRGASDFSAIIAQQLQNLLPAMLAQVSNQGNVGNQNGNVVNENVQENVGNVLVNGNRVVLIRWIEKMENVQDMSGCSVNQKMKYTPGSFVGKAFVRI